MKKVKMQKLTKKRAQLAGDFTVTLADLEQKLAEGLQNGSIKENSPLHLLGKREIRKLRDSINLSQRRSP